MFTVRELTSFPGGTKFCAFEANNHDICSVSGYQYAPDPCKDCAGQLSRKSHGCHIMSHIYVGVEALSFAHDDNGESFRTALAKFIGDNKRELCTETHGFVKQKRGVHSVASFSASLKDMTPAADELFLHCCARFANHHICVHFSDA